MITLIILILTLIGATALAMRHAPIIAWTGLFAAAALVTLFASGFGLFFIILLVGTILLGLASVEDLRRKFIAKPAFNAIAKVIPPVSDTEREALEGGTVGWDAELFSGIPDYDKLRAISPIRLTDEEQDFLDGETETLCKMIDDWQKMWLEAWFSMWFPMSRKR